MNSQQLSRSSVRHSQRRWRIPPVIPREVELIEGGGVLEEVSGEFGLLLWQSLRDVLLWAETVPSDRKELFATNADMQRFALMLAAGVEPALEAPLRKIATMLANPGRAAAKPISQACGQVSQWADDQGKLGTALAFARAAAAACPGDAGAAFRAGQFMLRRAEYPGADLWFRQAILLARQSTDWTSYSLAILAIGYVHRQRGNFPAARRFHLRALRAAKRYRLRDIEGGVLHDLHTIAIHSGQTKEAQEYAQAAFQIYGAGHPKLPMLAHDLAYFWLTQGYFAPALSIFQTLLPILSQYRKQLLPNLARAAGGAGEREIFEQTWYQVWNEITSSANESDCAEGLLELARGAASLNEWDRAEFAAERALEIALGRKESRIRLAAETVLDSVRAERTVTGRQGAENAKPPQDEEVIALANDFIRSLAACAP